MSQQESIQSFKIMSQNYKGQALAGLITQITQNPRVFQFTEVLQCPNIQNLQQDQNLKNYWDLLNLYAYGNYRQWFTNKSQYPELNKEQIKKLRQLTLVDLCIQTKVVNYSVIKIELGLDNDQNQDQYIDTLIIDSIYEGIISGKINQLEKVFKVNQTISRDLKESELGEIKNILDKIYQKNKNIQQNIEERINDLNTEKQKEKQRQNAYLVQQQVATEKGIQQQLKK